ncbi:c6 zinc finger domain containing protein [Ophiostoma piceae UAMH 11346]|uniref:C6 zinc finger domain containing protein n=1 Tax=Ophiostoma piceae (strain UAMH 11346) TaxID=1262450 RepID=S3CCY5_OPHP1|nr:c6 zinc finger domain containing protein [Ophiostoma piceae UAMH 11346]
MAGQSPSPHDDSVSSPYYRNGTNYIDPKSAAIAIGPNANVNANADQNMASSPPVGSYSPPAFTFTTPEGMGNDTDHAADTTASGLGSMDIPPRDRRASDEWDASKVPPSRFQKRKGSIYSTPNSRDGQVDNNYAAKFHAKHAELGYNKK